MNEQVKIFSHITGKGGTLIESPLEDNINEWLNNTDGRVQRVTQSESERDGVAHITVCIWYVPGGEPADG
jgi:hypothetical protein